VPPAQSASECPSWHGWEGLFVSTQYQVPSTKSGTVSIGLLGTWYSVLGTSSQRPFCVLGHNRIRILDELPE